MEAPHLSEEEHRRLTDAQQLNQPQARLEQLKQQFEQLVPEASDTGHTVFPAQDILEAARTAALVSQVDRSWRTALTQLQQQRIPSTERPAQEIDSADSAIWWLGYHASETNGI